MKSLLSSLVFLCLNMFAYSQGKILLLTDSDCQITINGEIEKSFQKNSPQKIELPFGEHIIQAKNGEKEITKIVEIKEEKQKIIKLNLLESEIKVKGITESKLVPITISEVELKLGSAVSTDGESVSFNKNNTSINLAFEKGDEIIINGDVLNKKGTFNISIVSYPDLNTIYSKRKLTDLNNHRIKIRERGIYMIQFGTNAIFGKKIKVRVERIPESSKKEDFNTIVEKRYRYEAIEIEKSEHFLDGGTKGNFGGGKNEIDIPFTIPLDAVEWYYSFSANRNEQDTKNNLEQAGLLKQLTKIVGGVSPTTSLLNIGIDLITKPPGADHCNIFILDKLNVDPFLRDGKIQYIREGSRKNMKSGVVKVNCCKGEEFYLGIENKAWVAPIHVGIEVVAIKRIEYLSMIE